MNIFGGNTYFRFESIAESMYVELEKPSIFASVYYLIKEKETMSFIVKLRVQVNSRRLQGLKKL